jgi:hypothetical protein
MFPRVLLLICLLPLARGEDTARWRVQFSHAETSQDERSEFRIADLKFPSVRRGVAVGAIVSGSSTTPMSAVTADGGEHWSMVPLEEPGRALFFLDDRLGWLVTSKGLWRTDDSGQRWRKIKSPDGITRVHFLSREHGFATANQKRVYETRDSGGSWTALPFTSEVSGNPDHTTFNWIEFVDDRTGLIGGASLPPRKPAAADQPADQRAWPHLSILAETRDGGASWKASAASLFGQITTSRLSPDGWGLGLIEFAGEFEWPSEVMFLDWKSGRQKRIYREKQRHVTDVAIGGPKGPAYLAAVEHTAELTDSGPPRKVIILRSEDALEWNEMPVDAHATARRVVLAVAGQGEIWAATDTGMILKLSK